MRTVLSIAGFDPSSGAGVTADLMVFAAHGLFGTSAITSLTVQSTRGVRSMQPVDAKTVRETLDCLHQDLPPAGVKIGMLATAATVEVVSDYLEHLKRLSPEVPAVLDPVIRSSSGRELLSVEGVTALRGRLLPLVGWITPNLAELSQLTGRTVTNRGELEPAVRSLQREFPSLNVLATGGHLDRPDDLLLSADGEAQWFLGEKIKSSSTHGTGCAFSSALLSRLVQGDAAADAVRKAKEYVAEAIRTATPLGYGHGPLNHLWPLR